MNKREALDIAITAMFREILREDAPEAQPDGRDTRSEAHDDPNPRPQFDFDESTCEHGGLVIDRSLCPIHGPSAQGPVTPEELDDITSETHDEANPLIARAQRRAKMREERAANQRLYPEDLPNMKGMGPPIDDDPSFD